MNTLEAIHARTSYRGPYTDAPVPREAIVKILEAGLAAPSGCNKQTTSLIAVDDPQVLKKLHTVIDLENAKTAPVWICVLTKRIIAYRDKCFATQDYSAAIQNMLLAIVDLGYETCWYEGHITDADRIGRQMADMLDVPQDMELVCLLPVGVAAEKTTRREKMPFMERAWFNGYRRTE
ncbi:MAG: nitroreductase family protein [Clostridia bacterium]|nr:nitroreductase family protein [Clostridia bacterium]